MIAKQRDLILLPFPFSNFDNFKVRPGIVISNNKINKTEDCIIIAVTSVVNKEPFSISLKQTDLEEGNLIKNSRIKTNKILTISQEKLIKKIGTINEQKFSLIKKELKELF